MYTLSSCPIPLWRNKTLDLARLFNKYWPHYATLTLKLGDSRLFYFKTALLICRRQPDWLDLRKNNTQKCFPIFQYPDPEVSAYLFTIDTFIVSLKNNTIIQFNPPEKNSARLSGNGCRLIRSETFYSTIESWDNRAVVYGLHFTRRAINLEEVGAIVLRNPKFQYRLYFWSNMSARG